MALRMLVMSMTSAIGETSLGGKASTPAGPASRRYRSTSAIRIRPDLPDPLISRRSKPLSLAIFLATGEAKTPLSDI